MISDFRIILHYADIDKHKKDVFKLMSLVNPANKIATVGSVKNAVERFLKEIMEDDRQNY